MPSSKSPRPAADPAAVAINQVAREAIKEAEMTTRDASQHPNAHL